MMPLKLVVLEHGFPDLEMLGMKVAVELRCCVAGVEKHGRPEAGVVVSLF